MGLDSSMQLIMSGVLNVTQLVGVSTSVWTMDHFGRRPLLLVGSACMTISHVIIAILVGLFSDNWPAHRPQGWTSVAFLFFYMLSFGASWGPVPWAMPSEIFPSSLRAKGTYTIRYPTFNSPELTALRRRRSLDLFQLAQQLHHRPHHAANGPKHGLRRLHFLRGFLLPQLCLDVLLRARDEGEDIGTDGSRFQGCRV